MKQPVFEQYPGIDMGDIFHAPNIDTVHSAGSLALRRTYETAVESELRMLQRLGSLALPQRPPAKESELSSGNELNKRATEYIDYICGKGTVADLGLDTTHADLVVSTFSTIYKMDKIDYRDQVIAAVRMMLEGMSNNEIVARLQIPSTPLHNWLKLFRIGTVRESKKRGIDPRNAISRELLRPSQGEYEDDWAELALCTQVDPELFFPEVGHPNKDAKFICTRCEIKDACLKYALEHNESYGIWGGMSERERKQLKNGQADMMIG